MGWIIAGIAVVVIVGLFVWHSRKLEARDFLQDSEALDLFRRSKLDFDALRAFFAQARHTAQERYYFCDLLAREVPKKVLSEWAKAHPDDASALLLWGRCCITEAWKIRGTGVGSSVGDEAIEGFFARLQEAEAALRKAAELAPQDPTPWAYLLIVTRGLNEDMAQAESYVREALRRGSTFLPAYRQLLVRYTEKWGGSHDKMFGLARAANKKHPGTELSVLLADAHIERALYPVHFENDRDALDVYLQRDDVREEVARAYDASLGAKDFQENRATLFSRHAFALWFYLVDDKKRLRRELLKIGPRISKNTWQVVGPGTLAKAKALAGV